jgi:hypothetical protein
VCTLEQSSNRLSVKLKPHYQNEKEIKGMSKQTVTERPLAAAEHHKKAAEHHEKAAHHHKEAAKHYQAGNHEKAASHAQMAHSSCDEGCEHAAEAAKLHTEQHGK